MRRSDMAAVLILLSVVLLLCFPARPGLAESSAGEEAEWTVMFYFCGSDLESKYSFATGNLEEIGKCWYPDSSLRRISEELGIDLSNLDLSDPGKVNVVIETGGCKEWHAESVGMKIDPGKLQRWTYHCYPGKVSPEGEKDGFRLEESVPLASMASPLTLTDFIRWSAERFPAKKYALVLWDHGGGSKVGLFVDEIFDGDVLRLYELDSALEDSGVHLELLLIDACLMANIETVWAVEDYANWLVASEEMVPGEGTAVRDWLQQLYCCPECDGKLLSRWICDMTAVKYAKADELSQEMMTWSIIDLTKAEPLTEAMRKLFHMLNVVYSDYPNLMPSFLNYILSAEEYGDGQHGMRDIASIFLVPQSARLMERKLRNELLEALNDAVVYNVRGAGHSAARGLSFCYAVGFTPEELEIYSKNAPIPQYLALLDAVTSWDAPDTLYETEKRLTPIQEIPEYRISVARTISEDGVPGLFPTDETTNIRSVSYRMYRKSERSGSLVFMGNNNTVYQQAQDGTWVWEANEPWIWQTVEGLPCCISLIRTDGMKKYYNVPVMIGTDISYLRLMTEVSYDEEGKQQLSAYEVIGVWQGYNSDSQMAIRNITGLAELAGRDYQLLYPAYSEGKKGGRVTYETGPAQMLYRSLRVKEGSLEPGTYYLEYVIEDSFGRLIELEMVEMDWDGEKAVFPGAKEWEDSGEVSDQQEDK